jgi:hypothetical protein
MSSSPESGFSLLKFLFVMDLFLVGRSGVVEVMPHAVLYELRVARDAAEGDGRLGISFRILADDLQGNRTVLADALLDRPAARVIGDEQLFLFGQPEEEGILPIQEKLDRLRPGRLVEEGNRGFEQERQSLGVVADLPVDGST